MAHEYMKCKGCGKPFLENQMNNVFAGSFCGGCFKKLDGKEVTCGSCNSVMPATEVMEVQSGHGNFTVCSVCEEVKANKPAKCRGCGKTFPRNVLQFTHKGLMCKSCWNKDEVDKIYATAVCKACGCKRNKVHMVQKSDGFYCEKCAGKQTGRLGAETVCAMCGNKFASTSMRYVGDGYYCNSCFGKMEIVTCRDCNTNYDKRDMIQVKEYGGFLCAKCAEAEAQEKEREAKEMKICSKCKQETTKLWPLKSGEFVCSTCYEGMILDKNPNRSKDVAFDSDENSMRNVVLAFIEDAAGKRTGFRSYSRSGNTTKDLPLPECTLRYWNVNFNMGDDGKISINPKCCTMSEFPVLVKGSDGNMSVKNAGAWILGVYLDGRVRLINTSGATKDVSMDTATAFNAKHKIANAVVSTDGGLEGNVVNFAVLDPHDGGPVAKPIEVPKVATPKAAAPKPVAAPKPAAPKAAKPAFPKAVPQQAPKPAPALTRVSGIAGKTFCITGKVEFPGKRAALQAFISDKGGFNANSVTNRVDYLITNDSDSGSIKNRSAVALGCKVITEAEFMRMANSTELI